MKIGIAADHRGFLVKEEIKKYLETKYEVIDYGTNSTDRTDYPIYGFKLGEGVRDKNIDFGIAICGSAIGISIACNKVKGVRCGKVNDKEEAIHARENDYVNVIALSGDLGVEGNVEIIDAFLEAREKDFDPAYLKRVKQIERYEMEEEYDR